MNVILLEPINNLGDLGEEVMVKPGFARNYLLPQGKAIRATAENREVFQQRREELRQAAQGRFVVAEERRDRLAKMELTIVVKAGDEGKLYGSVGTQEIAQALTDQGVEVHKREVMLPDGAIRLVGEYQVTIHLHSELLVTVPVSVVAE